ncbi:MAG: type ISP restriction/modification enzyme [Beijerinckiaceae bacterium]
MAKIFEPYLRKLREIPLSEHTEHTGRSALESLLNQVAAEAAARGVTIQHEPKRESGKGAPDFKIKRPGMILGYVEVKEVGTNLDKVLKSEQIKRYRTLSDNILLTDYLQWIWIDRERVKGREILAYPTDLESRTLRIAPERAEAVRKLIGAFFSEPPQGIGRAQQLALALATRSQLLRDSLDEELVRQEREHKEGRLYGLFQIFRDQVFHELTLKEFADAFAQMLAYGLFLARLNSDTEPVTLYNARQYIPGSFRLIRELVDFLTELTKDEYRDIRWVVEEVLSIVNGLDLASIHEDLSFRHRKAISRKVRAADEEEHRLFERDPFIYFYEDYLKAYDPAMRKGRGVYYTPPPIVNFIVRAVDDILKESFGIRDGLADHKRVTVLDFACGTGTFLLEVFERIFDNIGGPDAGRAEPIVREHFLRNIFGFEYLIAPYTIAHLKLSQYLKDQKHPLKDDERLQIFLTNTLEPVAPQANFLLPAISAEVESAQAIKEKPILVITGNPPYSGHSKNKGPWITAQIAKYREGFPELSKPAQGKWLQDDYVKFIRFAQMKMDGGEYEFINDRGDVESISMVGIDQGIVAVITNHSYLDNPTFKGMRKSLMATFNQIYILDLHGSAKKKNLAHLGKDENVFDIEQGVAIGILVKQPDLRRAVWHADLWGSRIEKYHSAADGTKASIQWTLLHPVGPLWLFRPHDADADALYRKLWSLKDIFAPMGDPAPGIVTTQDAFAISFTPEEAREKIKIFLATQSEEEARRKFRLCTQEQWNYQRAKTELPLVDLFSATRSVAYRPFDNRWTIWNRNVAVHRRERVTLDMQQDNLAIDVCRIVSGDWEHALAVDLPPDDSFVSNRTKERGFVFPVRVRGSENLGVAFRDFIDQRYDFHYAPEEILGYIYAVLYAPTYRTRYAEFLRIDFPRIPFPETKEAFEALSKLGWVLVQAHLLRELPRRGLAGYFGKGDLKWTPFVGPRGLGFKV